MSPDEQSNMHHAWMQDPVRTEYPAAPAPGRTATSPPTSGRRNSLARHEESQRKQQEEEQTHVRGPDGKWVSKDELPTPPRMGQEPSAPARHVPSQLTSAVWLQPASLQPASQSAHVCAAHNSFDRKKTEYLELARPRIANLNKQLADGPFFFGEKPLYCDFNVFHVLSNTLLLLAEGSKL